MNARTNWTEADLGDLSGKVAIVTGANSGLGLETSRALLKAGAHVVMTMRSEAKAQSTVATLQADLGDVSLETMLLDLADLESVRRFSEMFHGKHSRLDLLINNAGIMMTDAQLTIDGFESQLGTNHLGHFALTGHLLDLIRATPGARVVSLSSVAHRWGFMEFGNLMFQNGSYTPRAAYGRSKLANLLFAYELQRLFEAADVDAISVAAHPGTAGTGLADHLFNRWYLRPLKPLVFLGIQTPKQGARPSLRAATDPQAKGGDYFGPGGRKEYRGAPVLVESNAASHSEVDARKLWVESERLTGVNYESLRTPTE
ncbi:NAD(P)-dependent dehydrogenase (short-subunit alcohol dehydrogenase family) [Salinibacterium amurskyense]|uniref:NAD(P)-dependent dehydrogenase (Short-subunit alcohol dehydrogenase family) n=1 Tax=Salinibacterium amurskyense TaxID=205941 RepID=A0A2M9D601_9MICO|nr:oxidoreductase [Salinibacterium amurskyense]PJJ81070.1 NAD(P)-dependent dehydrogenase (short-subunit alcohol dehydrogenase family) [Salinibacterium amurskyense]RLQ83099.1 SDR family NAD(P)-dependent oxidoreductase [Salinibacterium amurskyense]GHD81677.1 short-chain dehydrogenase [Salinibacterium amurskyense]